LNFGVKIPRGYSFLIIQN